MRWNALFADLQAEAEAEAAAERRSEVSDRIRAEVGRLRLMDRLAPLLEPGHGSLRLGLVGHAPVTGELQSLGADWLLLAQSGSDLARDLLVPLLAVQWLQGVGARSAEPGWEGAVGARLTLRVALRRIVRDRSSVVLGLTGGDVLGGRLARVGADHVELGTSTADAPATFGETAGSGVGSQLVPLSSVAFVERR